MRLSTFSCAWWPSVCLWKTVQILCPFLIGLFVSFFFCSWVIWAEILLSKRSELEGHGREGSVVYSASSRGWMRGFSCFSSRRPNLPSLFFLVPPDRGNGWGTLSEYASFCERSVRMPQAKGWMITWSRVVTQWEGLVGLNACFRPCLPTKANDGGGEGGGRKWVLWKPPETRGTN